MDNYKQTMKLCQDNPGTYDSFLKEVISLFESFGFEAFRVEDLRDEFEHIQDIPGFKSEWVNWPLRATWFSFLIHAAKLNNGSLVTAVLWKVFEMTTTDYDGASYLFDRIMKEGQHLPDVKLPNRNSGKLMIFFSSIL